MAVQNLYKLFSFFTFCKALESTFEYKSIVTKKQWVFFKERQSNCMFEIIGHTARAACKGEYVYLRN